MTLSVILTTAVLFPGITAGQIFATMIGCALLGLAIAGYTALTRRNPAYNAALADAAADAGGTDDPAAAADPTDWRMPPLAELGRAPMSAARKFGIGALRIYLAVASVLAVVKIVELALGH